MRYSTTLLPIFIVFAIALSATALPIEEDQDQRMIDPVLGVMVQGSVQEAKKEPMAAGCTKTQCASPHTGNCFTVDDKKYFRDPKNPELCTKKAPKPKPKICCKAMTLACLACSAGVSEKEFCSKSPGQYGCPKPKPKPTPKPPAKCPTHTDICAGKTECRMGCPCPMCLPLDKVPSGCTKTQCASPFDHTTCFTVDNKNYFRDPKNPELCTKKAPAAADPCLKVDYAAKDYKNCCANGGYKKGSREKVCQEAGKKLKKKPMPKPKPKVRG
jgi:hypothetical protein